ncbi:MAG: hypothetical protein R3D85_09600 [Paracoccaceae bacterium]
MKKLSILAAAAALAAATAAPVAAGSNDPFVSTQGGLGENAGIAVVGVVAVGVIIAASDGS